MRFRIDVAIDVAAAPPSARLTLSVPGSAAQVRDIRLESDSQGGWMPIAPDPLAAADFHRLLRHFRARRVDGSEALGRYLFAVLLGDEWWKVIRQTGRPAGDNLIELALAWPPAKESITFDRLPWELLHDGTRPLVAANDPRIAITRVIPHLRKEDPPRPSPAPLDLPPRVLFVIGSAPDDPRVRAAAEVLGLLRSLENPERTIHARILERASPKRLKDAIATFRPEVVHFICHGDTRGGQSWLELQPDDPGGRSECDAETLLDTLRPGGRAAPTIVVLSACRTAEATDTGDEPGALSRDQLEALPNQPVAMASLGAQLVFGGVPIVIGMSGRVSDVAARLFTRRFEACLLEGQPLVAATADARRAPFLAGRVNQASIDWAYPTLLLDDSVDPQYAPTPAIGGKDGASQQDQWVKSYRVTGEKKPVFCGRQGFFEAFDDLFRDKGRGVLVAYARPDETGSVQYGKTRILEQLTFRALRDGHLPLVLSTEQRTAAPMTLSKLLDDLRKQEQFAVDQLGLHLPRYRLIPELKKILDKAGTPPAANPVLDAALAAAVAAEQAAPAEARPRLRQRGNAIKLLREELEVSGEVTGRAVCLALRYDMWALADEFRDLLRQLREPRANGPRGVPPWLETPDNARAVVLLDNLDRYEESFISGIFELTNQGGLGSAEDPIPLVVSFSLDDGPATQVLRPIAEGQKPYANVMQLQAFAPGEDILCYHRVLLHPFDPQLLVLQDLSSGTPLAVDGAASTDTVAYSENFLRTLLKGQPTKLKSEMLYVAAREAKQKQYLVDADDSAVLKELLQP